uniref:Epidermal growth factor receptor kinase substrate 8 n=1 Tax=Timema monikensis TaxID=170555 RepID=A0A7R9E6J8_9NEOP|nr:unnamed protein product [Timema monikensis]
MVAAKAIARTTFQGAGSFVWLVLPAPSVEFPYTRGVQKWWWFPVFFYPDAMSEYERAHQFERKAQHTLSKKTSFHHHARAGTARATVLSLPGSPTFLPTPSYVRMRTAVKPQFAGTVKRTVPYNDFCIFFINWGTAKVDFRGNVPVFVEREREENQLGKTLSALPPVFEPRSSRSRQSNLLRELHLKPCSHRSEGWRMFGNKGLSASATVIEKGHLFHDPWGCCHVVALLTVEISCLVVVIAFGDDIIRTNLVFDWSADDREIKVQIPSRFTEADQDIPSVVAESCLEELHLSDQADMFHRSSVHSNGYSTDGQHGGGAVEEMPTYLMEHLATFTVSKETSIMYPADGMRRLLQLEKSNGIWSQKMQMRLDQNWVLIMDYETGAVMERFPVSMIQEPTAFTSHDPMEMYNNILVFIVGEDRQALTSRSEMHIFQCQSISAQDLVEDLKLLRVGKVPPGRHAHHIPPPPATPPPEPPSNGVNVREQKGDDPSLRPTDERTNKDLDPLTSYSITKTLELEPRGVPQGELGPGMFHSRDGISLNDETSSTSSEKYERDVTILNHCFDDIEKFIARLQHAAAASRELERRRRDQWKGYVAPYHPVFLDGWSPDSPVMDEREPATPVAADSSRGRGDDVEHYREPEHDDSHYSSDYFDYENQEPSPTETNRYAFDNRNYQARPERYSRDEREHSQSPGSDRDYPPGSVLGAHPAAPRDATARSDISADSIERNGAEGQQRFERSQSRWLEELRARGGKVVQVTYPRTANNDKELTVIRGEYLEANDSRKWWKARNSRGQVAHVPHTIVTPFQPGSGDPSEVFSNPLYAPPQGYHRQYPNQDSPRGERDNGAGIDMARPTRSPPIPPPAPADWVRKERLGKKGTNPNDPDLSSDEDGLPISRTREQAKHPSIPPPPPPPLPPADSSSPSPTSTMGTNRSRKSEGTLSRAQSSQDLMQEELKAVLTMFREKRPNVEILTTPKVYINQDSSPDEVQKWLQAKSFSQKYYKTVRSSELRAILAKAREKVDDPIQNDFKTPKKPISQVKNGDNYDSEESEKDDTQFGNMLKEQLRRMQSKD